MKSLWSVFLRILTLTAMICQAGALEVFALSPRYPSADTDAGAPQWHAQPGEMPIDYVQVRTFGELDVPYLTDTDHINFLSALVTDPGYIAANKDQIYVVENQGQRLLGYEPDGTNYLEIGTAGLYVDGSLNDPVDAVVDPNGNLWILTTRLIWVYDADGNFLFNIPDQSWDLPGDDPLRFNWTGGIAFIHSGPDDNYVLISEMYQQSVKYFSVDLSTIPYTLEYIATITGGFGYPKQVEAVNDKFYLADAINPPVIWECELASPYTCTVFDGGSWGNGDDQLLRVDGLAADATYLYVTDADNQRVKRCTLTTGTCEGHFITAADSSLIDRPVDVGVNSDGTLMVGDYDSMTVLKFNADGTAFTPTLWIGTPYEPYFVDDIHYYGPAGVEVDAQGNVYIIERQGNRIIKVNELGEQQWTFGVAGVPGDWGTLTLSWPDGSPAVDSQGRVYLRQQGQEVVVLDPDGNYYDTIYYAEPDPGALNNICSVAIDANDDIYVSDCGKNVVKVYGPDYAYKYTIGSTTPSSSPFLDDEHFWGPKGIAFVDLNTFYLVDGYNKRVERCNRPDSSSQDWSCKLFASLPENWSLGNPEDVAVDAAGRVYVIDSYRAGLFVFTSDGNPFAQVGFDMGSEAEWLRYPSGVAVDAQGNVYVADRHNAVVRKYVPVTGTSEFLFQAGGGLTAVAKLDNYAVVADGAGLHVLDLAGTTPSEVGRYELLTDTLLDMVISGDYAYAANELGMLSIFDLSDPGHPSLVTRVPTQDAPVTDVDVWGSKLYAAAGNQGLLVYDLADPEYPLLVGQMQWHEETSSVALASTSSGLTAFITARDSQSTDGWLYALDVDDPGSITLLDQLDTPGTAESLAVQGDTVIVADGTKDGSPRGLRMVNAADPADLSDMGVLGGYDSRRVEISGNYAYFLDGSQALRSVDISTPSEPVLADSIESNAEFSALLPVGGTLWAADLSNGLRRINVSDPSNMSELTGWFNAPGKAEWVQMEDGYIYQAAGNKGLQIVDTRDPLNPAVVGQVDLAGDTSFVKVDSGYAYTANGGDGMYIINVSNPAKPQWAGGYWDVQVVNVDVHDQVAYVVGNAELHILDVSDPGAVQELGTYSDPNRSVQFVQVEENGSGQPVAYLLLSDYLDSGYNPYILRVLDVSDPSNIGVYGDIVMDYTQSFDVLDGMIYFPLNYGWGSAVVIIDATNPSSLVELGRYSPPMGISSVQVATLGENVYAFIPVYENGLLVADVTDPANTFFISQIDLPGSALEASIEGNRVVVAGSEAGLFLTWFAPLTVSVVGNNDVLTTQFDEVTYTFAADSLEDQARLIHTPVYEGNTPAAPDGLRGIEHAFIVNALDYGNDRPVEPINSYTLEISYAQKDLGSILESSLKLYFWNGTAWEEESSTLDEDSNTLTAYPEHFSTWRVFGVPYNWVYLPALMK
jgi:sugar lactone lactonase YvrE